VFAELEPRIAAHTARGGRLAPLHIGDTWLAPPDAARFDRHADAAAADLALYRYGPIGGLPALREAYAATLVGKGWARPTIDPQREVLITAGATHGLFCAARALFDDGDEVLLASPYWPLSPGVLRAAGATPVEMRIDGLRGADLASALRARATERTRGIYLITPNNPNGRVLDGDDLAAVAAVADERDLWILADEVYADYTYGVPHRSLGTAADGLAERTVTAYSFSKSHALAGARVGVVVGPATLIAAATRVATHSGFNVPLLLQRAALAALTTGADFVDRARVEYQAARDLAVAKLAGGPVEVPTVAGGSYLFLDLAPLVGDRSLRDVLEVAIDHGVLLAPGHACGAGFEKHARLCFTALPRPELADALDRLRTAFAAFAAFATGRC
jgi:aspartate/methionine/tyrosine aminotransferase